MMTAAYIRRQQWKARQVAGAVWTVLSEAMHKKNRARPMSASSFLSAAGSEMR